MLALPTRGPRGWLRALRREIQRLSAAGHGFVGDDCPMLAAAIAYYALLSVFPLSLAIVTLAGSLFSTATSQERLIAAVGTMVPGSQDFVRTNLDAVTGSGDALGAVSIAGLIWTASGFFLAVQRAVDIAWGAAQRRSFWRQRLVAAAVMGLGGAAMLGTLVGTAAVELAQQTLVMQRPGLTLLAGAAWHLMPAGIDFLLFAATYRYVPNVPVRWTEVWAGAATAAVLFGAAKIGFLWYVTDRANYSDVYGPIASVVAFLVWSYLSAAILLFGAELAAAPRKARASAA